MTNVIYADILIVINTYVNYFLLRLSGLICKKNTALWRIALGSLSGSFYSFIILADNIPNILLFISRFLFAAAMILISFKLNGKKDFFRLFSVFFGINFAFAGIMLAVWFIFCPQKMVYNNGVVYFDINTLTLVILTVICYLIIKLIHKIATFKAPQNTVYEVELECLNKGFVCKAFLDTGNSLKEPFSQMPVIVVNENLKCSGEEKITLKELSKKNEEKIRIIPCSSVGNNSFLYSYKAQKVHVKGIDIDFESDRFFIALTDMNFHGGDFQALLGPAVFENTTKETEKDYV